VFEADWKGGVRLLPAGVVGSLILTWLAVLLRGRSISFQGKSHDDTSALEFKA